MHPEIPRAGLDRVLSGWVGRGSLFEALAVLEREDERNWSADDIRLRVNRMLMAHLEPFLAQLPKRRSEWLDYMPAARTSQRIVGDVPFSGVAWAESRRRYGWPPTSFVGKQASRSADMLSVQVLRWVADQMRVIGMDDLRARSNQVSLFGEQLTALVSLLEVDPIRGAVGASPSSGEMVALGREGAPWGHVAKIARLLSEANRSSEFLLRQLLVPDDGIRWRLFHLAVLGTLLEDLRDAGCTTVSLRPLSGSSSGPNYRIQTPSGGLFDLWFEASGVWSYLGLPSPFAEATRALRSVSRSNGADILLLSEGREALVLESKYSDSQEYIAREGYYQAVAYAAEAHSRLAPSVCAAVVGPEDVVTSSSFTSLASGRVGIVPPSALRDLLRQIV